MSKYSPHVYEPDKSIEVFKKTEHFLEKNKDLKDKVKELGWVYYNIGKTIPQTTENFWSGHFFPFMESWDELQISFNLAMFGLYKQAYVSLRSALELGLLSVYYNINDDGHNTVKSWLKSKDTWEANTPRINTIWSILESNNNISNFNKEFDFRARFDKLSFLHNYVHTKGVKYSNKLGRPKSNYQTFESQVFTEWLQTYEEIVIIILTLHLLKYPIGVIEYEWDKKCGIDNPFPVLEKYEIQKIKKLLPKDYVDAIKKIAKTDEPTQHFYKYLKGLPNMTEIDKENQIINLDKIWIEHHPNGFVGWEKEEKNKLKLFHENDRERILSRIKVLRKWAKENNLMTPKKIPYT